MGLTRDQSRRIDEFATSSFGLPSLLLMENAGRNAAEVVRERYAPLRRVVILAGSGNNGGDGLVVARHLANANVPLRVRLCGERARLTADAATQLAIVERMGIEVVAIANETDARDVATALAAEEVVVDALFGTGFRGSVREPVATLIHALNGARAAARVRAVVALDLPSGLDCDTGAPAKAAVEPEANATVEADLTVTFVAAKAGFAAAGAGRFTGEVVVRDIGLSAGLLAFALRT